LFLVLLKFEVTLWPTIRCDFFLRFRSMKTYDWTNAMAGTLLSN